MTRSLILASLTLATALSLQASHPCSAMATGFSFGTGSRSTFVPFHQPGLESSIYTNISSAAADPSSAAWVTALGSQLRSQYSPYQWNNYGEPYYGFTWYVVDGSAMRRQNVYIDSPDGGYYQDSDPGSVVAPLPIPFRARIQASMSGPLGGSTLAYTSFAYPPKITDNVGGDMHLFVLDNSNCLSYELYNCYYFGGNLHCGTASVFDMLAGDHQRPYGMTSASVSGAPFAGLMGLAQEVAAGASAGHALPCNASFGGGGIGRKAYSGIASHHQYGNTNDPNLPPLGAILRLKASFDTSHYSGVGKGILETLKTHGCVITDGGQSVSFYLEAANAWGSNMVDFITSAISVNPTNFDFVQVGSIYSDSIGGPFPPYTTNASISSFTATPSGTVSPGAAVTLTWSVGNATAIRYLYPEIGPVRGPSVAGMTASGFDATGVVVHPARTTTYSLMVQNGGVHDGGGSPAGNRVTATVCVPVTGSTACP